MVEGVYAQSYNNGCSLTWELSLKEKCGPVTGILEDIIPKISTHKTGGSDPFVSLSIVAAMSSRVDVKMARSGSFHAEIVVEMGEEWDYRIAPGEFRRAVGAIIGYVFSTSSKKSEFMRYLDEWHPASCGDILSDAPYND